MKSIQKGDRVRIRWFECYGRGKDVSGRISRVDGTIREVEGIVAGISYYAYSDPLNICLEGDSNHYKLANVVGHWPA